MNIVFWSRKKWWNLEIGNNYNGGQKKVHNFVHFFFFLQNYAVYKCINPSSLLKTVNNHYKRDQDHLIFNVLNSICS